MDGVSLGERLIFSSNVLNTLLFDFIGRELGRTFSHKHIKSTITSCAHRERGVNDDVLWLYCMLLLPVTRHMRSGKDKQ